MVKPLPLISKYRARVVDLPLHPLTGCLSLRALFLLLRWLRFPPLSTSHLAKTPGTPISPETQNLGARLTPQGTHQLGDNPMSGDLQTSLSRLSNHGQYDNFEAGYDDPLHVSPYRFTPFFS